MKKLFVLMMTLVMMISLVACGSNETVVDNSTEHSDNEIGELVNDAAETVEETVPVKTQVTFYDAEQVYNLLKAMPIWSKEDITIIGDVSFINEAETITSFTKGPTWMSGDKSSDARGHDQFKYDYNVSGMFVGQSSTRFLFDTIGKSFTIIKLDTGAIEVKTEDLTNNENTSFKFDADGYLKSKSNNISWLADDAAVAEFINMANESIAFMDYTINDFIDFNAFLTAITE